MSLRLESVAFRYAPGDQPILESVSLELRRGQIDVIIGANGTGKSTLLGLCSGRLRPWKGRVLWEGADLESLDPRRLASRIAALPQTERVAFDFSCLSFVLFARSHSRSPFVDASEEDREVAKTALETLGVGHLADRAVTRLSGGEFQLVRLARCVAQDATVLVLDEPTAMLDPGHTLAVSAAIRRIAASGRAVVLATHDLGFAAGIAAGIADTVHVLQGGSFIAAGPGRETLVPEVLEAAFGVAFEVLPVPTPVSSFRAPGDEG